MKYVSLVLMVCLVCGCGSTSPTHTWADEITTVLAEAQKTHPNIVIHRVLAQQDSSSSSDLLISFEFYSPPHDLVYISYIQNSTLGQMRKYNGTSSSDLSDFQKNTKEDTNQVLKKTNISPTRAIEMTREKGVQFASRYGGDFFVAASLRFSPEIAMYFPSSSSAWLVSYDIFPETTATIPSSDNQSVIPKLYIWIDGKTGQVLWESDTSRFPPT